MSCKENTNWSMQKYNKIEIQLLYLGKERRTGWGWPLYLEVSQLEGGGTFRNDFRGFSESPAGFLLSFRSNHLKTNMYSVNFGVWLFSPPTV